MLNCAIQDLGDVVLFRCTGRMVAGNVPDLHRSVAAAGARQIVLDLAEVTAIDAAGLGSLIAVQESAKAAGAHFKLMNITPRINALLQLTKLDLTFKVCSVAEMLHLICRAANPNKQAATGNSAICGHRRFLQPGKPESKDPGLPIC
ncbi:MAG: STAS domain-containing protein [Acidobacteria bacterium]|nr:STAS domain-containing protein [Acidobacteriota bacterium]